LCSVTAVNSKKIRNGIGVTETATANMKGETAMEERQLNGGNWALGTVRLDIAAAGFLHTGCSSCQSVQSEVSER